MMDRMLAFLFTWLWRLSHRVHMRMEDLRPAGGFTPDYFRERRLKRRVR